VYSRSSDCHSNLVPSVEWCSRCSRLHASYLVPAGKATNTENDTEGERTADLDCVYFKRVQGFNPMTHFGITVIGVVKLLSSGYGLTPRAGGTVILRWATQSFA
jgi:hypothetical protein